MENSKLSDINFKSLLQYGGQPIVKHNYEQALKCRGFCIDCDKKGYITQESKNILMSHGCDTYDLIKALGKPIEKFIYSKKILFLLDEPGGDYGNGLERTHAGFSKVPPVLHYYWIPKGKGWPTNILEFKNYYGHYFAYLINKYKLKNVYITNIIKCKVSKNDVDNVRKNCIQRYLLKEIDIFKPEIIICFGKTKIKNIFNTLIYPQLHCNPKSTIFLYHPSFIDNRCQTIQKTKQELVNENDAMISEVLSSK